MYDERYVVPVNGSGAPAAKLKVAAATPCGVFGILPLWTAVIVTYLYILNHAMYHRKSWRQKI